MSMVQQKQGWVGNMLIFYPTFSCPGFLGLLWVPLVAEARLVGTSERAFSVVVRHPALEFLL